MFVVFSVVSVVFVCSMGFVVLACCKHAGSNNKPFYCCCLATLSGMRLASRLSRMGRLWMSAWGMPTRTLDWLLLLLLLMLLSLLLLLLLVVVVVPSFFCSWMWLLLLLLLLSL